MHKFSLESILLTSHLEWKCCRALKLLKHHITPSSFSSFNFCVFVKTCCCPLQLEIETANSIGFVGSNAVNQLIAMCNIDRNTWMTIWFCVSFQFKHVKSTSASSQAAVSRRMPPNQANQTSTPQMSKLHSKQIPPNVKQLLPCVLLSQPSLAPSPINDGPDAAKVQQRHVPWSSCCSNYWLPNALQLH